MTNASLRSRFRGWRGRAWLLLGVASFLALVITFGGRSTPPGSRASCEKVLTLLLTNACEDLRRFGEEGAYDVSSIQPECEPKGVPYDSAIVSCSDGEWKGDRYVLNGSAQRSYEGGPATAPTRFGMTIVRRDGKSGRGEWAISSISFGE